MAHALDIQVIPALVHLGSDVYHDGIDLTPEALYAKIKASLVMPTTAVPGIGVYIENYRQAMAAAEAAGEQLEGIVSVHVASRLSGLYSTAEAAARELADTVRIVSVDTGTISMGSGWIAVRAAQMAQTGAGLDEIVAWARAAVPRLTLLALLQTLEYAGRSGRLGKASALLGTLLNIKPIVEVRGGQVLPVEKVRTWNRGVDRLEELARQHAPFESLIVLHTQNEAVAMQFRDRLADLLPGVEIPVGHAGITIGTYAGPGALGIAGIRRSP